MQATTIRLFVVDMTDVPSTRRESSAPRAQREELLRTDPFIAGVIEKLQREVRAERQSRRSRVAWSSSDMWQRSTNSPLIPNSHFDYELPDCDDLFGIDQGTSIDEVDLDF